MYREWARYYRFDDANWGGALHARFIAHRYPRHTHDYFVVGLVESGAQAYFYRGARHVTPAGQIFLVNPGEPHTGEAAASSGYVYRTLCLRECFLSRVIHDIGGKAKATFLRGAVLDDAILAARLMRFHNCIAGGSGQAEQESLLLGAIATLFARYSESPIVASKRPGTERPAVKMAREYIEAHSEEDVSLGRLAKLVNLSPHYFARAFEGETGTPPHTYLEGVRIKRALKMLDAGSTIISTALSVGYSDQSHLTRRFRRFMGITPGEYIRRGKNRQIPHRQDVDR